MSDSVINNEHGKHFNEKSFWEKMSSYAVKAGRETVEKALWLFYAFEAPATPTWAKMTIAGALGYLILPADLIPDFIPVIGLTDDAAAIAAALAAVAMYIDEDVKAKASAKIRDWFDK